MCGDIECRTPVESIFDNATCRLHADFPSIRSYRQVRKDSESDHEEAGPSGLSMTDPTSNKISKQDDFNSANDLSSYLNLGVDTLNVTSLDELNISNSSGFCFTTSTSTIKDFDKMPLNDAEMFD